MILVTHELTRLVHEAIRAGQADGALTAFDIPDHLVVQPSKRDDSDYAIALMPLAKPAKMNPFQIAQRIENRLPTSDLVGHSEVAAPGYLNFRLNPDWLKQQVNTVLAEGDGLYQLDLGAGKTAQVEFVSANPTGPLTVGRSRGAVLGDATARVLEAVGYAVQREYYFNNAGRQMENLGNSLRARYLNALDPAHPLPSKDDPNFYQGDYLIGFASDLIAEHGDSWKDADWQPFKEYAEKRMFEMIRATLKRVDIAHDAFFNENSLYENGAVWKTLDQLTERGHTYRAERPEVSDDRPDEDAPAGKGEAVWFRSHTFGDAKDRVLVKASGDPTYTLPDIAYHQNKLMRGFALAVNVLGSDHYIQAQVVRYGLEALGYDPEPIHVIYNQMLLVMRNGVVEKGSTRRGIFDPLDDLIDQTSPDAVRYFLLARTPDSQLSFDIDLAVKQSNENPVYYIQYAHVRCAGIMREAALRVLNDDGADLSLLGEPEQRFLKKVLELGDVIETAATQLEAYRIAYYALELANTFHPIFDAVRVMHSEVPPELAKARLRFYRAAQVAFRRVLSLMGMSAPDHM